MESTNNEESALKETFSYYAARFLVYISTYLLDIDPQELYKTTDGASRRKIKRIYNSPSLRLPFTRIDKFRKIYCKFRRVWVLYVSFKLILLFCVQIIQRESLRRSLLKSMNGVSKSSSPNQQLEEEEFWLVSVSSSISSAIGNPLDRLIGYSTLVYSFLPANTILGNYLYSYTHNHIEYYEMTHMNIFLNFKHEIKRIDLMIEEKLDSLMFRLRDKLIGYYYFEYPCPINKSATTIGNRRNLTMESDYEYSFGIEDHMSDESLKQLYFITKSLKTHLNTMRPAIYCQKYQLQHSVTILKTIFYILLLFITPILIVPYEFLMSAIDSRCLQFNLSAEQCNIGNAFSWQDSISSGEIMSCMILITWTFVVQVDLIIGSVKSQSLSLFDMNQDLKLCLLELRRMNSLESGEFISSAIDNELQPITFATIESSRDALLLRVFIKLEITEGDIRTSSKFISRTLDSFLSIMGCSLLLSMVTSKLEFNSLAEMRYLRASLVVWLLLMCNLVLFYCANHHSNAVKLDKLIWSIISQLIAKAERKNEVYNKNVIGSYWSKLALGHSINNSRNSVMFFKLMCIDYRRLLELNFVFISLASLIMRSSFIFQKLAP